LNEEKDHYVSEMRYKASMSKVLADTRMRHSLPVETLDKWPRDECSTSGEESDSMNQSKLVVDDEEGLLVKRILADKVDLIEPSSDRLGGNNKSTTEVQMTAKVGDPKTLDKESMLDMNKNSTASKSNEISPVGGSVNNALSEVHVTNDIQSASNRDHRLSK
jgi:hypothetical protein